MNEERALIRSIHKLYKKALQGNHYHESIQSMLHTTVQCYFGHTVIQKRPKTTEQVRLKTDNVQIFLFAGFVRLFYQKLRKKGTFFLCFECKLLKAQSYWCALYLCWLVAALSLVNYKGYIRAENKLQSPSYFANKLLNHKIL